MKIYNYPTAETYKEMANDGITETTGASESYGNGWVMYYGDTEKYLVYEGKEELEYIFMTTEDLAKYLLEHKNKEVGFTDDSYQYVEEATGWYGFMVSYVFDSLSLLVGWYGDGCHYATPICGKVNDLEMEIEEYFETEFNRHTDGVVCVDATDIDMEIR
jgi:hypothetical protein